ncbi:MAG: sigma-70 family RNA polymerase sigma factor [Clostridia bacterium]|nr:sigma-70 family RNA polymerase sigma factor [Clostridia bacterium]
MKKIKYEFADGTTSEIEVTNELYALHLQLVQEEKRNHWRETRRHTSLNYLLELGVDFADTAADPCAAVELREDDERIHNAIKYLSDKQRALLEKVFNQNMSLREIERQTGVTHQALSKQIAVIYKKLKKYL